jgi:membrane-associated phospholipid phosphatase
MRTARWRFWVLTILLPSSLAKAQGTDLRYDARVDIPVAVAAGVAWIGSEALKSHLAAQPCRWCDRNADGSDGLNPLDASVRNALRWRNTNTPDMASSVVGFVLTPAAAFGMIALAESHDRGLARWPVDALLILEATTIAADVNQLVKYAVGRERPFVHALPEDQKPMTAHPADNNTSFYSGHTNLAFALAVSSGTVATMRGYREAPWVWSVGLALATATAYLRIAADRHYFTDVLVGAGAGSAIGFSVPYFLHSERSSSQSASIVVQPTPAGAMISGSW